MSNTWDIMQIIDRYTKRAATIEKYSSEGEELRELYAQNLRLQCRTDCGHIITIDDFIHWIDEGWVNGYDGYGRLCDNAGNMGSYIVHNRLWIQENRLEYPFVIWFNK